MPTTNPISSVPLLPRGQDNTNQPSTDSANTIPPPSRGQRFAKSVAAGLRSMGHGAEFGGAYLGASLGVGATYYFSAGILAAVDFVGFVCSQKVSTAPAALISSGIGGAIGLKIGTAIKALCGAIAHCIEYWAGVDHPQTFSQYIASESRLLSDVKTSYMGYLNEFIDRATGRYQDVTPPNPNQPTTTPQTLPDRNA